MYYLTTRASYMGETPKDFIVVIATVNKVRLVHNFSSLLEIKSFYKQY